MPSGPESCPTPPISATTGSDTLGNVANAPSAGSTCRRSRRSASATSSRCSGCPPQPGAPAVAGRLLERSRGKDTTTGHWELMGILTPQAMPTYPHGFPDEVIDPFMNQTGPRRARQRARQRDGDHPGARRGAPADGQVDRLHERRLGLPDRGARGDDPARGAVRGLPRRAGDPDRQACGRPRDRAAVHGRAGQLPAHREPPRLLARAAAAELPVDPPRPRREGLRRREDLATSSPAATSTSRSRRSRTSRASSAPRSCCAASTTGFVFTNLVETDMLWGHRNDPENFHRCLQDFDRRLPDLLDALREGDLLILTSDHGCDPTTPSTDHSREYALLLAYVQGRNAGGRVLRGRRVRRRRRDRERVARRQARRPARRARQADPRAVDRDPARRADPAQARRRGAGRRRARRARPRLRARRGARLPDGRVLHGRLLPRPVAARDVRPDRRDDPERRDARPRRRARPQGRRQALDRRRGGQDLARRRPDRRRLRRPVREDERPRPRAHGRHARQARVDPGLPRRAHDRRVRRAGARRRAWRSSARPRRSSRRPDALRAARRDRDGRPALADRRVDHVEEARRRRAGDRARRQGRRAAPS